jgi:hypothetical protein
MFTATISLLLTSTVVAISVALGIGMTLLSLHFELMRRSEQRHAEELLHQQAIITDHETTINAYRQFVQSDPELALTSK